MKYKQVKRSILVEHFDESQNFEIVLSKATAVKTPKRMIHFDELPDGTWRMIYHGDMIPDFTQIKQFFVVRED